MFTIAALAASVTPSIIAQDNDADPELAAFITGARRHCDELKKEEGVLAEKARQLSTSHPEVANKVQGEVSALHVAIQRTEELLSRPAPKTPNEREEYYRAVAKDMIAANSKADDVRGDVGVHRNRISANVPDDKGLYQKVSPPFDGNARGNQGAPAVDFTGSYQSTSAEKAKQIVAHDKAMDGGVVLEGEAIGLPAFNATKVTYDPWSGAIVIGDWFYLARESPPWVLAALCRAVLADDHELVGVSLTAPSYTVNGDGGHFYRSTAVGRELALLDGFWRDITFNKDHFNRGYGPPGFTPASPKEVSVSMLVRWSFSGFQFQIARSGEIRLVHVNLESRIIPSKTKEDGSFAPDEEAFAQGFTAPTEFIANARHITDHLDFYQRERLVRRAIDYGAAAAIFRSLKKAGVNLDKLAQSISGRRS